MADVQSCLWLIVRRTIIFSSERTRKGTKMFEPIRKLARAMRAPSRAEREMAYLNGALDRVDLEYRQRQIDNGLFLRRV